MLFRKSTNQQLPKVIKNDFKNIKRSCLRSYITMEFPGITIIIPHVDKELNAKKFIVPGLGDFGDRFFGTEEPTME